MIGPQALYMCTEINPEAASCSLETAHCNKVHIQPVITDLVKGLLPRLKEKVDLLVFNPPYVVTPPEEKQELRYFWCVPVSHEGSKAGPARLR
ncbi:methyltransferase N6AMT1-like [Lutra lutra]|uniref:methyltransferase N6AMT1-like n=1 Tax=Lutra lutra TaxID=9657 RepID=UPI001FD0B03D|nr:methyltransferase N6AMT1-like [Lutra lutra]